MDDKLNGAVQNEPEVNPGQSDRTDAASENQTEQKQQDPIEALKAEAQKLGLNADELQIMTKQQMQSYVDSVVSKAIKTREENLRKQQHIEEMKKKGQYEELLKEERKIALEDLKNSFLQAKGIPSDLGVLIQTNDLTDLSLAEAKNALSEQIEHVTGVINAIVEQKVKQKLETMESGTFKNTAAGTSLGIPKTMEELRRLPYTEQVKLFQQYPDLYNQMSGQ